MAVRAAFVLALVAAAGCTGDEAAITHLHVKAQWQDAAIQPDQLRVTVLDGTATLVGPTLRPLNPGPTLVSGTGVAILLSDGEAARALTVRVEALRMGAPIA